MSSPLCAPWEWQQRGARKSLWVWDPTVYSLVLGHVTIYFTCTCFLRGHVGLLGLFLYWLQGLLCVVHMAFLYSHYLFIMDICTAQAFVVFRFLQREGGYRLSDLHLCQGEVLWPSGLLHLPNQKTPSPNIWWTSFGWSLRSGV